MLPCLTLSSIRYGSSLSRVIQGTQQRPPQRLVVVANEKGAFGMTRKLPFH